MSHHFPFPWGRTFLLRVILIILPVSLSCQKKDETPPPPTVAEVPVSSRSDTHSPDALSPVQGEGSNECCEVVANPELKGRMGRLIMQFPNGGDVGHTRVDIFHPIEQKALKGGFGNQTIDLLPGIYDLDISKKRLKNVPVKSGHDTRVKVGLLRISAGKGTRIDIVDAGKKLTGGYGNQVIGLPVGSFDVQVAGQTEKVTITQGEVTDF
jgi:hypothetical protein